MRCISLAVTAMVLVSSGPARADESPKELIDSARKLLNTPRQEEGRTRLEKAIELLKKDIEKEPKSDALQFQLGLAHFYLGEDAPAMAAFSEALKLNVRHAGAHFFKGLLLRQEKEKEAALGEFEQAKSLDPQCADYWCEWGSELLDKGDRGAARTALEEAVRLDPKHWSAIYSLAILDVDEGKIEAGLEKDRRVIELEPACTNAHYNAGQACQTLGKHAESLEHFRAAAKLDPNDLHIAAKIVQCCQAVNQLKDRDKAREKVLELFKKGGSKKEFYCRDQFSVGKTHVMALEYFEMKGDEAVRFSFQVSDDVHKKHLYRISLGSYDVTNEFAHSKGTVTGDERYYHLDRYYPSNAHETFCFFKGEPEYDKVRDMVERIIKNELKPTSSMTPTSQGSTIEIDPRE